MISGTLLNLVQDHREPLDDLGGKPAVLEGMDHVRILKAHLVDVLVFLLDHFVQLVEPDEPEQDVRRQVPALRHLDVGKARVGSVRTC